MIDTGLVARSTKRTKDIAKALAARARDGADGQSIVNTVESLPLSVRQEIDDLQKRLKVIEDRPEPLIPKHDNDAVAVPKAFGDLVEHVTALAQQVEDLEEGLAVVVDSSSTSMSVTEGGDVVNVNEDGGTDLTQEVSDLAATTMRMFQQLLNEISEVRRRTNKIDGDVLDLVSELETFARMRAG